MSDRNHSKTNGASGRKRRYERSTPIGRLLKNIVKMRKVAAVTLSRMTSWGGDNSILLTTNLLLQRADAELQEVFEKMSVLQKTGWTPPKKRSVVIFEEGESVQIADKHRKKYLSVYGKDIVDDLVISKVLDSGELAVKHGRAMPFIVAKSHIERRRAINGAKAR